MGRRWRFRTAPFLAQACLKSIHGQRGATLQQRGRLHGIREFPQVSWPRARGEKFGGCVVEPDRRPPKNGAVSAEHRLRERPDFAVTFSQGRQHNSVSECSAPVLGAFVSRRFMRREEAYRRIAPLDDVGDHVSARARRVFDVFEKDRGDGVRRRVGATGRSKSRLVKMSWRRTEINFHVVPAAAGQLDQGFDSGALSRSVFARRDDVAAGCRRPENLGEMDGQSGGKFNE